MDSLVVWRACSETVGTRVSEPCSQPAVLLLLPSGRNPLFEDAPAPKAAHHHCRWHSNSPVLSVPNTTGGGLAQHHAARACDGDDLLLCTFSPSRAPGARTHLHELGGLLSARTLLDLVQGLSHLRLGLALRKLSPHCCKVAAVSGVDSTQCTPRNSRLARHRACPARAAENSRANWEPHASNSTNDTVPRRRCAAAYLRFMMKIEVGSPLIHELLKLKGHTTLRHQRNVRMAELLRERRRQG